MADLDNILHNDEELNEEQLMKYLEGNLSDEEKHAVEKQMADSAFVNDAVEGLQSFANPVNIETYVEQLNRQLHKQTAEKKRRKEKRKLKQQDWIIMSVIIVILLCMLAYLVVNESRKRHTPKPVPTAPAP